MDMKKFWEKLKNIFKCDKDIKKINDSIDELSVKIENKLDKNEAEYTYLSIEDGVAIKGFENIISNYYPKDVIDKKIKVLEDKIKYLNKILEPKDY